MITEMERFVFLWRRSLVVGSLGYTATQGYLQENRLLVIFMLHLIFVFDIHPHGYKTAASCLSRVSIFQEVGGKGKDISFFVKSLSILLAKEKLSLETSTMDRPGSRGHPSRKKKNRQKMSFHVCFVMFVFVFSWVCCCLEKKTIVLTVKGELGN